MNEHVLSISLALKPVGDLFHEINYHLDTDRLARCICCYIPNEKVDSKLKIVVFSNFSL